MKFFHQQVITVFLIITIILLPFSHLKMVIGVFPFYFPEIFVTLSLIAFLITRQKNSLFTGLDRGILLGGILFLGGSIVSLLLNPYTLTGLGMIKSWFGFPFLFALLLWRDTQHLRERDRMLIIWYGVLCGIALRSFYYLLTGDITYDGRLQGDYASPNFLAYSLAPAILMSCWSLLYVRTQSWLWFANLSVLALLVSVFFATHSYGAWGGVFVALGIFLLLKNNHCTPFKKSLLIGLSVLSVFLAFIYFEHGSDKWQALMHQSERSALASRLMIWQSALKMVSDSPVFGIGIGRFQQVYLSYQAFFPPYLEWAVPEPHNIFLAVYLSTGLVGLLGFLILMSRLIFLLWRQYQKNTNPGVSGIDSVFFLGLSALFLVYGFMDTPLFTTELSYVFFLWFTLAIPRKC